MKYLTLSDPFKSIFYKMKSLKNVLNIFKNWLKRIHRETYLLCAQLLLLALCISSSAPA